MLKLFIIHKIYLHFNIIFFAVNELDSIPNNNPMHQISYRKNQLNIKSKATSQATE